MNKNVNLTILTIVGFLFLAIPHITFAGPCDDDGTDCTGTCGTGTHCTHNVICCGDPIGCGGTKNQWFCDADSYDPKGIQDPASCSTVNGWVCDEDNFAQSLDVHVYVDGPAESGTFMGSFPANVTRSAGVAAECGGYYDHGFNAAIPATYKDGQSHTYYVYGINIGSGGNAALWGNPQSISCSPPPASPSNLQVSCNATGTQATLSWDAAANADYYSPRVDHSPSSQNFGACDSTTNTGTSGDVCINRLTSTSYTMAVSPGDTYQWWLHSRSDTVAGWYPPAGVFGTNFVCAPTPPTPSVTIGSVCLSSSSSSNIGTVSWSGTTPNVTYVDVSTVSNFSSWGYKAVGAGSTSTTIIDGFSGDLTSLAPNTNYYVRTWNGYKHSATYGPFQIPACPNCSITSASTGLITGGTGTYTASFSSPNGQLGGEIFHGNFSRITYNSITGTSGTLSGTWTPAAAGTYEVCCRAWYDSVAECRPSALVDASPRVACAGPNVCTTVTVTNPTPTTVPPTATSTTAPPTATATTVPPTATNTPVPPTATNTPAPGSTSTPVPPTTTNTPIPPAATNTPVPTKTWNITYQAVCNSGTLKADLGGDNSRAWSRVYSPAIDSLSPTAKGTHTVSIQSARANDDIYAGMQDGSGTFLPLNGTPPNANITYANYWTGVPNAKWSRNSLPVGNYTLQFTAPASWCLASTATTAPPTATATTAPPTATATTAPPTATPYPVDLQVNIEQACLTGPSLTAVSFNITDANNSSGKLRLNSNPATLYPGGIQDVSSTVSFIPDTSNFKKLKVRCSSDGNDYNTQTACSSSCGGTCKIVKTCKLDGTEYTDGAACFIACGQWMGNCEEHTPGGFLIYPDLPYSARYTNNGASVYKTFSVPLCAAPACRLDSQTVIAGTVTPSISTLVINWTPNFTPADKGADYIAIIASPNISCVYAVDPEAANNGLGAGCQTITTVDKNVAINQTSYTLTNLSPGTTYFYRIMYVDNDLVFP